MVRKPSGSEKLHKNVATSSLGDRAPAFEHRATEISEHHIRERAYGIWIEEGRPDGREVEHWLRATKEFEREAP